MMNYCKLNCGPINHLSTRSLRLINATVVFHVFRSVIQFRSTLKVLDAKNVTILVPLIDANGKRRSKQNQYMKY